MEDYMLEFVFSVGWGCFLVLDEGEGWGFFHSIYVPTWDLQFLLPALSMFPVECRRVGLHGSVLAR